MRSHALGKRRSRYFLMLGGQTWLPFLRYGGWYSKGMVFLFFFLPFSFSFLVISLIPPLLTSNLSLGLELQYLERSKHVSRAQEINWEHVRKRQTFIHCVCGPRYQSLFLFGLFSFASSFFSFFFVILFIDLKVAFVGVGNKRFLVGGKNARPHRRSQHCSRIGRCALFRFFRQNNKGKAHSLSLETHSGPSFGLLIFFFLIRCGALQRSNVTTHWKATVKVWNVFLSLEEFWYPGPTMEPLGYAPFLSPSLLVLMFFFLFCFVGVESYKDDVYFQHGGSWRMGKDTRRA